MIKIAADNSLDGKTVLTAHLLADAHMPPHTVNLNLKSENCVDRTPLRVHLNLAFSGSGTSLLVTPKLKASYYQNE